MISQPDFKVARNLKTIIQQKLPTLQLVDLQHESIRTNKLIEHSANFNHR